MSAPTILGSAFAALLNSLWQSAAMALLIWTALRYLPAAGVKINAATRCAVWWALLAAVALLPVIPQPRPYTPVPDYNFQTAPAAPQSVPYVPPMAVAQSERADPPSPLRLTAGAGLLAIFAVWSAFSLFRILQLIRSYRYLSGLKRRSTGVLPEHRLNFNYWLLACGIDRSAQLLISTEIASPMAVGFRRPAVIVPATLMSEFTPEELDHVILHELAHIARYDDWTNLLARAIGALLPVHPVAIWLLRKIEQDREIACDDWVVAMTGDARPYAASLTRLFELCSARRRQLLATGMADRASHLGERIEALLRSGRDFAPRVSVARVALGVLILAGLVLAGAQTPHWIAFAQDAPLPPVAPLRPTPRIAPLPQIAPVAPAPVAPAPRTPVAAAQAPLPQEPQVALQPLPELTAEFQAKQQELKAQAEQLRQMERQLQQQSQKYSTNHPDMVNLSNQIRAHEAQLRARQFEIKAMEAQLRDQENQTRVERASRGPNGSFLAALVAAGYGDLPVDAIIEMRNAGISIEFLRAIGEAGWGKLPFKDLIDLAHSGVSVQYLRAMREAGFKSITAREVIEFSNSGVQPGLVRSLREAFPQITTREIIDAGNNGLNAQDLRQAREYGPSLTLPQIIRLKQAGVI